jgi:hypothetical protein
MCGGDLAASDCRLMTYIQSRGRLLDPKELRAKIAQRICLRCWSRVVRTFNLNYARKFRGRCGEEQTRDDFRWYFAAFVADELAKFARKSKHLMEAA